MLSLLLFLLRIVNTLELKANEEDIIVIQKDILSNETNVNGVQLDSSDLSLMQNISNIMDIANKTDIEMLELDIDQSNSENNNNKSIIEENKDVNLKSKNPCPSQSVKCSKYLEKYNTTNIETIKPTSEEISLSLKENGNHSKIHQKIPNKSENESSLLIETSPKNDTTNMINNTNSEISGFDNETEVIAEQQRNPISIETLDTEFILDDGLSNKSRNSKEVEESLKSVNIENNSHNKSQETKHENNDPTDNSSIPFISDEYQQSDTMVTNDSEDFMSILDIVPFNKTGFQASTPIRKCCEPHQFFSLTTHVCENSTHDPMFIENVKHLIKGHNSDNISLVPGRLTECPYIKSGPRSGSVDALTHSLSSLGILHHLESDKKYDLDRYCLEMGSYNAEEISSAIMLVAFCPNYFKKCCPMGQKLSGDGCIDSYDEPSLYMDELFHTMKAAIGFPQITDCTPFPLGTAYESNHTEHFFVTYLGLLSLTYDDVEVTMTNYCIDDLIDSTNTTHLYAMVCEEEIYPDHPIPASLNNLSKGTVGKCCPPGHHAVVENIVDKSTGQIINEMFICEKDNIYLDIITDPKVIDSNITNITFTFFPQCEIGKSYHVYELSSINENKENFLDGSQNLITLSKYGKCIKDETLVHKNWFCLDYLTRDLDMKPVAILCQPSYHNIEIQHEEKHTIMAVFLGFSCSSLIATAISLVSTRVRRGLVTVKKVNTLAGRILLSYVLSYLFGFLTLAVAHKTNPEHEDGIEGCRAIAGIIMFFMLSAFHWNTSICLESLLSMLRVSTSEGRRYLLHSLWAWGIPGFITALALSLDAYKESLPCGTITPEIGVYRCFFSDVRAQLLYFYLPMFITLVANLGLLLAARAVRINNLKKLEHGPNRKKKGNAVESTELQGRGQVTGSDTKKEKSAVQNKEPNAAQSSGKRTHQNRNLWLEAVKLVMWSGVTLSIEVISYFVFRFSNRAVQAESWYEYLWYIPSIVNSLRGFGIFVILVLTEENRKKFSKALGTLSSLAGGAGSSPRQTHSAYSSDDSAVGNSSIGGHGGRCNMSVTTTFTQISSIHNKFSTNGNISSNPCSESTSPHQQLAKSVSQIGRQGSFSSESDFEGKDVDADGNKRRPSLAIVGMTPLESVDEEDVTDQQITPTDTFDNTKNLSFA